MAEKDYISREEAIANSREYNLDGCYDSTERAVPVDAINSIPAADVVEVVRCVNCKYWNPRYNKSYKGHFCEVIPSHGRLIDANALRDDWLENGENEYVYDTNAFLDSLDNAPTVIEAEEVTK